MKGAFLFFVFVSILFSCKSKTDNTDLLNQSAELFFTENKNEDVLIETARFINHTTFETRTLASLLQAGAYCELSQAEKAKRILQETDTVKLFKNQNLKRWYQFMNGLYLFRTANYPQAFNMLSQVISTEFDERAKALAYRLLARIHFNSGDSNKATEYLALSTKLFEKTGLRKSVAINHKILGRQYANKKEFAKATKHFEIAKAGLERANDSIELFYIHINLIGMKIFQGKYAEAKQLARKNAVYITEQTDRQALALLYNNQGEIELLLQNYDSCRIFYSKTLEMPLGYITDLLRRGNACIGISKAYLAENNIPMALQYAQKALEISTSSDLSELQYNANVNMAELYKKSGQSDYAFFYLNRAMPYLEEQGRKSVENSETVYKSTINLIDLENKATKIRAEQRIYIITIIAGISFTIFLLIYGISTYWLLRSRNGILKSLVKKNLQLIDDERKLNKALHSQLIAKKVNRKSSDEEKDRLLFNDLNEWLLQNKGYLRKDITADIVARELGTNREYLSRAISTQQLHFNELINKYRIEETIKILTNKFDNRHKYNLNVISSEVGFNSISVFIDSFRKQTGMNPAQFRSTIFSEEMLVAEKEMAI